MAQSTIVEGTEQKRLNEARVPWKKWGPCLSERQWGTVREDYTEGNHGEDVKEYGFHLDSTPTHSSMQCLYKYPQREFPFRVLIEKNRQRSREEIMASSTTTATLNGKEENQGARLKHLGFCAYSTISPLRGCSQHAHRAGDQGHHCATRRRNACSVPAAHADHDAAGRTVEKTGRHPLLKCFQQRMRLAYPGSTLPLHVSLYRETFFHVYPLLRLNQLHA